MKKGLLSLLAVALTVVGCQNYDDQFEELKSQIEGVEAQISGLPDLTNEVNSIKSTVEGLQTALATVSSNVTANGTAIGNNATAIANNGTAIADNATAIGNNATAIGNNGTAIGNNGTAIAGVQGVVTTISGNVAANGTAIASATTAIGQNADAITAVSAAVTAVNSAVGLNGQEIASIQASLTTIAQDITDIENALADVATTADLLTVSNSLADVAADVEEILQGAKSVNQAISMTNDQDIAYALGVISLGANSPSAFIINGDLTVDLSTSSATLSAASKASATLMLAKIISTLGTGNTTDFTSGSDDASRVKAPALAYVQGNYAYGGADPLDDALVTIKGSVTIRSIGADDLVFTGRTVDGGVNVTAAAASATTVDFSNSTFGGGLTPANVTFTDATSVNVGKISLTGITANNATDIIVGYDSALAGALNISGTSATTINLGDITSVGGALTITATGSTNVDLGSVASVSAAITVPNTVASLDLDALTATGGALDISAVALELSSLATISHTTDLNTSTVSDYEATGAGGALQSVSAAFTYSPSSGVINVPGADFAAGANLTSTAQTITAKTVNSANLAELDPNVRSLTLMAQDSDVTVDGTEDANLQTFVMHASADTGIDYDGTSANASLTQATFDDVETIDLAGHTAIATITTLGVNRTLTLTGNTALVTLNVGHTYTDDYTSAQEITLTGATALTSVDLTTVVRLRAATITGNTAMTRALAPGTADPLTGGANPSFAVHTNNLSATFVEATPYVAPNGIDAAVPYGETKIDQRSLFSWRNYIDANNSANSPTFDLAAANHNGIASTTANAFTADTDSSATPSNTGNITTAAELSLVVSGVTE
jgi:prefoldin subunit 5